MIRRFLNFRKTVISSDLYIMYVGDYSNQIGPPNSMIALAKLLKKKYSLLSTDNLLLSPQESEGASVKEKSIISDFRVFLATTRLKCFLSKIRFVILVLTFNIKAILARLINKKIKLVITQPLLLPLISFEGVFFIKRANLELMDIGTNNKIFYLFEKIFVNKKGFKLIYLVKQSYESSYPYSIIPNHFYKSDFEPRDSRAGSYEFHSVGTWSERKGADLLYEASSSIFSLTKRALNVYGGLGEDILLNSQLDSKYINYHGVQPSPYNNFCKGDVFISFSRVEGLQRSLVEALFMECVIVGFPRPDILSLQNYPGVFIIDPDDMLNSLTEIVNYLSSLDCQERCSLGSSNRVLAISEFSEDQVTEKWEDLLSK